MWYLILPRDSSLTIFYSLRYLAFTDYDSANQYAKDKGILNATISDDISILQ